MPRRRVLVVTPEPLAQRMAGPAIRALELGRAVAARHDVDVVSLAGCERTDEVVRLSSVDEAGLRRLVGLADVVVMQGDLLGLHPWLVDVDVPLVVDAYDPFHLEQLEQARPAGETTRRAVVRDCVTSLSTQLSRADLVLCASDRQRAMWLGHLAALGRVNPVTYDDDPSLSSLVTVVPFGVASTFPSGGEPAMRGVLSGVGASDPVVLWGGGIYPWFDPDVLIRAMAVVRTSLPQARLVFLGAGHPVLGSAGAGPRDRAEALAAELGLLGSTVFFHDGWVPYDQRHRWLAEADVGVSTHHAHVETEFAFRTRCLDYLWAGLPVVTTDGDAIADLVRSAGLGAVVPPSDVDALAAALLDLLGDPARRAECAAASAAAAERFRWPVVAEPLLRFCDSPRRAPDLVLSEVDRALLGLRTPGLRRGLRTRLAAAFREGGPRLLARRLVGRLRRR